MIDRIIDFSVKNRLLVFAVVAAAVIAGWWSMNRVPLDALPDLSDTQVIIYSRWDRSPDLIEDQVTYPIVTAMLGAPGVTTVRGFSDFGYSFVYVIFEDGTDIYWARSRTLEYLSGVSPRLPAGVETELGPDATGLGWIYQYALVDPSGRHGLDELRSYQDWYLRYYLKAVSGVAEVAPVGGFERQYQINVDPNRLQAYGISIRRVVEAVRGANVESGARLIEFGGAEHMVRGRGYARSLEDFANVVVGTSDSGSPIRVRDIGEVAFGPDIRRGVTDLDGLGEAVSGIVVMRQGQNALDVINRVKARIEELKPGMPEGVEVVPVYDRSELIVRSIDTLKSALFGVIVTVILIIMLFLWHVPSALIPVVTIPVAVLISFIPFRMLGLTANIMSLGGIAIAIGTLVDASIVVVEQTHKKLEEWDRDGRKEDYRGVVVRAIKEVGAPSFFALLVTAAAFLPVLTLEAEEGRLFRPLAYTKTLTIVVAAFLAITFDPALRMAVTHFRNFRFRPRWLSRTANAVLVGKVRPEEKHPVSRFLIRLYEPAARWTLRRPKAVIAAAILLVLVTVPIFFKLGSEFMPPLDEGSLFYMPTTMPGISIQESQKVLQLTDRIIKGFPEVERVFGKAGRAETSTDPAPLSMLETVVTLKPKSEWRKRPTWYSSWAPRWLKSALRHITPDSISRDDLIGLMNDSLQVPGLSNAWTQPIKGRIDMLTTGIRTPVGLKVQGADLAVIEEIGLQIESLLSPIEGTRGVFAERTGGGYFVDVEWRREELARYGLLVAEAQEVLAAALGGENVGVTVEGRARYPVNVRYMRDFRSDLEAVGRILVPVGDGGRQIPLAELAAVRQTTGPAMIRDEDGLLTGYVYVDVAGRDPKSFIRDADRVIKEKIALPAGYAVRWSGQFEAMSRVRERLNLVIPITLFLILVLLYLNTKSVVKTSIVLLAVPFSAVGALWLLYLLGYNLSVGVWVGLIALLGIDAETGVFMLLYLDLAHDKAKRAGRLRNLADLQEVIIEGAVHRLRPKFMTVCTEAIGLLPIMWATGTGADVMKRIAAPVIGGVYTSFLLELLVYPAIYQIWRWDFGLKKAMALPAQNAGDRSPD
ncbi:MAG: heavy metal efflux pump, CzcA family [Candidatus Aminicenantes bacterium]|nr:heavy metal efflux pump, CzcA family [Candidatus Aminicenantes bacterium]